MHILIDNLIGNVRRLRGKFTGALEQKDKIEEIKLKGNDETLMSKVMSCINENLGNSDFNVDMLTKELGISRAQLHRKMKEITGVSTAEFIRNHRLEQAAKLLAKGDLAVTQVAYAVGFNSAGHFSVTFKNIMECRLQNIMKQIKKQKIHLNKPSSLLNVTFVTTSSLSLTASIAGL